jgi:hypothetical protein
MSSNTTYARMFSDSAFGVTKLGNLVAPGGPLLCYVRFALKLTAGFAHVKLYAVLRDI